MYRMGPNAANSTPLDFLERSATLYADRPSVVYNGTVFTWSQTHHRCLRLASALSALGIAAGDVVSVMAPNVPAVYEMHFGVPMSGAILNTINPGLDALTVTVLLRHAQPKLVFVDPQSIPVLAEALHHLPHPRPCIVPIDEPNEPSPAYVAELTYEKLIEMGDPGFMWVRPKSAWAPMTLNYTSGVAAAPKGVVNSHHSVFNMALDTLTGWSIPKQPVYLWTPATFDTNSRSLPWGIAAAGGLNVCLRNFDAAAVYSAIADHKVTHLCGAPGVLNMLANAPDADRKPLPGTVHILTDGAPPSPAVLRRGEVLGFTVSHGYGLADGAGVVMSTAERDRLTATEVARLKARQGVRRVLVINPSTSKSVAHDGMEIGEVMVRGASTRHLMNEEALRTGGWFYTGDVAVVHPDGYVEIKGRSQDVTISGAGEVYQLSRVVDRETSANGGAAGRVVGGDVVSVRVSEHTEGVRGGDVVRLGGGEAYQLSRVVEREQSAGGGAAGRVHTEGVRGGDVVRLGGGEAYQLSRVVDRERSASGGAAGRVLGGDIVSVRVSEHTEGVRGGDVVRLGVSEHKERVLGGDVVSVRVSEHKEGGEVVSVRVCEHTEGSCGADGGGDDKVVAEQDTAALHGAGDGGAPAIKMRPCRSPTSRM